nr:TlpA disulfide reductase family protein [uncultured Chitinophaga sp.]
MRFLFGLTLITFLLSGPTEASCQYRFTLTAPAPAALKGKTIYLRIQDHYSLRPYRSLDSIVAKNDLVQFSGTLNKPCEQAYLFVEDDTLKPFMRWTYQFIMDTGLNVIREQEKMPPGPGPFGRFVKAHSPTDDLFQRLQQQRARYMDAYGKEVPESPGIKDLSAYQTQQLFYDNLQLIKEHPDNYYGLLYLRQKMGGTDSAETACLETLRTLKPALSNTWLGKEIDSIVTAHQAAFLATQPGRKAPVFSIRTSDRKILHTQNLAGTPYLIVFSATWCVPCQQLLPDLQALYEEYKDRGLKVLYFNLDDNDQKWEEHIKKHALTWTNVSEGTKFRHSKIAQMYNIHAIPNLLLVDKQGIIRFNTTQLDDTDQFKALVTPYIQQVLQ